VARSNLKRRKAVAANWHAHCASPPSAMAPIFSESAIDYSSKPLNSETRFPCPPRDCRCARFGSSTSEVRLRAGERVIAQSLGIGRTAVGEYIRHAAVIGITWPVPNEPDDPALERKQFASAGYNPPRSKPLPDWAHMHAELRRRGVTLALLWQDYRGQHPDRYGYSRFCDL
jgi:hypothetical protein